MGAFFIFKTNDTFDLKAVDELFSHKGFAAPNSYNLGKWRLIQYRKILLNDVENFIFDDEHAVFCCGTAIYYGLSYRDSLRRLLSDFQNNSVNQSELIGHFCLLYWNNSELEVLTDQMNTFHVFVNDEVSCLSSSFLAMLSASPRSLPLNRLAVCEKLSTGYIISPDTLVEGISQINDELAGKFSQDRHNISFISHPARPEIKLHDKGIDASLNKQIELLEDHFAKLSALNSEYTGELGLSDGYDSRIVLALSKLLSKPLSLHTHQSTEQKCHSTAKSIVKQLASKTGRNLTIIPTRHILFHEPEEMERILDGCLYFFDARCSHNMGAFSETYTKAYRERILAGGQRFTLNGLGGEVFRNYYENNRLWPVNTRHWINNFICYCFAEEVIGDDEFFQEMHGHRLDKIRSRIDMPCEKRVDLLWIRRYYSEVRMPDCDSNNSDAQNQLSFYHMPFIQPKITYEGINAHRYIGLAGTYQMAMLRKISPELSEYPTHYGYCPAHKIPLNYRLRHYMREFASNNMKKARKKKMSPVNNNRFINQTGVMLGKCQALRESKEALLDSRVVKEFDKSVWDNPQRATTFYIGYFLREFHNKLKW